MQIRREPFKHELAKVGVLSLVPLQGDIEEPDADIGHDDQHQGEENQA
jgi:hypothetical protein